MGNLVELGTYYPQGQNRKVRIQPGHVIMGLGEADDGHSDAAVPHNGGGCSSAKRSNRGGRGSGDAGIVGKGISASAPPSKDGDQPVQPVKEGLKGKNLVIGVSRKVISKTRLPKPKPGTDLSNDELGLAHTDAEGTGQTAAAPNPSTLSHAGQRATPKTSGASSSQSAPSAAAPTTLAPAASTIVATTTPPEGAVLSTAIDVKVTPAETRCLPVKVVPIGGHIKCEHNRMKINCRHCGYLCEHGRRKHRCKDCAGSALCQHSRRRHRCKICGDTEIVPLCEHGNPKHNCKDCDLSAQCAHGVRKNLCPDCRGPGICDHGRRKDRCKDCGGSSICPHGRQKHICRDCKGNAICPHGRRRYRCKECGGSSICAHGRRKDQCRDCGGKAFCVHKRRKGECRECITLSKQLYGPDGTSDTTKMITAGPIEPVAMATTSGTSGTETPSSRAVEGASSGTAKASPVLPPKKKAAAKANAHTSLVSLLSGPQAGTIADCSVTAPPLLGLAGFA